jgi:hypothetical protein
MKRIPFASAAAAALLLLAGCSTAPEPASPPSRTARETATDHAQTMSREGGAKLADDAAASATSRAK